MMLLHIIAAKGALTPVSSLADQSGWPTTLRMQVAARWKSGAMIRCGATGYDFPIKQYEIWRDVEMTFNPEEMRIN